MTERVKRLEDGYEIDGVAYRTRVETGAVYAPEGHEAMARRLLAAVTAARPRAEALALAWMPSAPKVRMLVTCFEVDLPGDRVAWGFRHWECELTDIYAPEVEGMSFIEKSELLFALSDRLRARHDRGPAQPLGLPHPRAEIPGRACATHCYGRRPRGRS